MNQAGEKLFQCGFRRMGDHWLNFGVFGATVDFSQRMLSWSRESKRVSIWTARMLY